MDKSAIIAKLREHESELKAAGIEHLFLHGSYARGTAIHEVSDVDMIAGLAPGRGFLFSTWSRSKTGSRTCWECVWIFLRQTGSRSRLPPKPHARRSLPLREPTLSLRDILDGIDMIVQFVGGMDLDRFREDPKTVAAVERKLR
jgi:hypothetical protein